MHKTAFLIATAVIAGCAQQPPAAPAPVTIKPSPVCKGAAQCSTAWIRAHEQLQRMTGMRLAASSDTYLATYPMTRIPHMVGEAYKIDNGDGSFTIKARFTCRHDCRGLDASALNLFNSTVGFGL